MVLCGPQAAPDYEILLFRISGLVTAKLGLQGDIQTVSRAAAVPRPEFSNKRLEDAFHHRLLETLSIQLFAEESHCLCSAPNQSG